MYMGYPDDFRPLLERVAATRERRLNETPRRLTVEEKEDLLRSYHPDYRPEAMAEIRAGVNRGDRAVKELVEALESYGQVDPEHYEIGEPDLETDVLVVAGPVQRQPILPPGAGRRLCWPPSFVLAIPTP